jgi:hypothetical protein
VPRIRALASSWPTAEGPVDFPTVALRRPRRRTAERAQPWVLVAAAFVAGLAIGAAAFVGVWRTSDSRGDRADAARAVTARKLHAVRTRSATLSTKLRHTRKELAATKREKARVEAQLRSALNQAAAAGQQATSNRTQFLSLASRASKVRYYVTSLRAYVENTPGQDLDSAFLQSQLDYLSNAVRRLQSP